MDQTARSQQQSLAMYMQGMTAAARYGICYMLVKPRHVSRVDHQVDRYRVKCHCAQQMSNTLSDKLALVY